MAEFNKNKNHRLIIEAIKKLVDKIKTIINLQICLCIKRPPHRVLGQESLSDSWVPKQLWRTSFAQGGNA